MTVCSGAVRPGVNLAPAYELKAAPEDFQVFERLDWTAVSRKPLSAAPQQLWLIEKRNLNTLDVIRYLARGLGASQVEFGYAGRKDRRALTRQWITVPNRYPTGEVRSLLACLSGSARPPAEEALTQAGAVQAAVLDDFRDAAGSDRALTQGAGAEPVLPVAGAVRGLTVLGCQRKLRIGGLIGNRFRLVMRLKQPLVAAHLNAALKQLSVAGFPNFFGTQRVTPKAVTAATQALLSRQIRRRQRGGDRGWALSVARAHLFNQVLAARLTEANGAALRHCSGPLWGRGRPPVDSDCAAFETRALESSAALLERLEHAGLKQERRALVVVPTGLDARLEEARLALSFALPAGSYATELVAHLFRLCLAQTNLERSELTLSANACRAVG